jgi:hypothetical protein
LRIKKINTTPYHPQTSVQAEVCNKTIAAYSKTKALNSTLSWEQYMAPMMFAYNPSYHPSTKSTVTFGIEPRTGHNSNPDLRKQYGDDLGTIMFQR